MVKTALNLHDAFNVPMRATLLGHTARPTPPPPIPVATSVPIEPRVAAVDMTANQAWFDDAFAAHPEVAEVEYDIGTARVPKHSEWKTLVPKLIVPMIILVIAGVFVAGFFAFDGDGGRQRKSAELGEPTRPAPITVVEPSPEPVRAVEPVAPIEPAKHQPEPITPANLLDSDQPKLVDVRIDSIPSGATVMIVDRGKATFLGTTPISTPLDASRTYDLVFTYANKPTQLEHLDPSKGKRLAIVLGKPGNQVVSFVAPRPANPLPAVTAPKPRAATLPRAATTPRVEPEPPVVDPPTPPVETKPVGEGVLLISSKPPCEIYIDGAATGLTTPQRGIKLPAGMHKITLVNTAEKIRKTIGVEITADQPTKVIQDLMTK